MTREVEAIFEGGVLRPVEPCRSRRSSASFITCLNTSASHRLSGFDDPAGIQQLTFLYDRSNLAAHRFEIGGSGGGVGCVCRYGEWLQLDVETGEPKTFWTAAGSIATFGHPVQIQVFDLVFDSTVYSFADPAIGKNLLGRVGWLNRIRLGIVDHDRELYLADYNH